VTKGLIELGGKQVGVLYVEKHDHGPVIAIKNVGQDVKEGGIYFRYVGETRLIKPGELRQIIAAREQRAVAELSARMNRVAIGKEATIDLAPARSPAPAANSSSTNPCFRASSSCAKANSTRRRARRRSG
jgi:hypothetical protein